MLQSIAAWLLQTYAGEYIENLNADQLTIGYGGIELENLSLKPSAFKKLGLPLKLISGSIGKLNLVIPYANPSTEPWVIKIEDLFLVVETDTSVQFDHNLEEELDKQRKLDKLELEWKANKKGDMGKGSWWSRSWFPSLYSSISSKIADNLQTDIKNVKIQYKSLDLSLTVFVESLSAHTSNDQWVKTTEGSGNQMKYKLLLLEGLSIYSNKVNDGDSATGDDKYILGPVFAEGRIIRNASKVSLATKDGPRFYIEMLLEDVKLSLTNKQFQFLANVMEDLNLYFKSIEHSSSKPSVSVRKDPKRWWQFAIKSVLEPIKECNRRRTKDFLVKRVLDINLYAVLYDKHLREEILNSTEKESLKSIESKMKYEEIAILRKVMFAKHTESSSAHKFDDNVPGNNSNASWTGWIMSYNPLWQQQNQNSSLMNEDAKLTKEEEKFLDELTELSVEGDTLFNRDSIFAKIAFTLNHGCVVLVNENKSKEVLNVDFNGVNISSNVYSKSRSWEWMMALQTFLVAAPNSAEQSFPHLMSPQNHTSTKSNINDDPFLYIKFIQKQLYRNSAYNVSINMQPSNVVYNFSVVTEVKEFFQLPKKSKYMLNISTTESMTHRFQTVVNSQIQELKLATKAEFDNIIAGTGNHFAEEGNEWTVYLDIAAPSVIMPVQMYNGDTSSCDNESKKMVILNLGRLMFYNDHAKHGKAIAEGNNEDEDSTDEFVTPSSTPPSIEEHLPTVEYIDPKLDISEIMEKFYDSYTLELSMVQVLVSDIPKDWFLQQPKGFGPDHIIEEFSVKFSFKRRTIFTTDPALPALTLSTVLPQLCVHIDQTKMNVLYQNINMIKASFSDQSETQADLPHTIISRESSIDKSQTTELFQVSYADLLAESKLVLAKFTIEKLSLGLHSRGRCFAELQIEGVECEYVKRPQDTSVSFILSSLMLVDAMQTFGSDYELLVTSKCSQDVQENDVLIHICYQMINADCPSLGNSETTPVQILSVNFNSLHINGNLETIVELHNVVNQILNQQKKSLKNTSYVNKDDITIDVTEKEGDHDEQIEISAYFKQIDLLLFYSQKNDDSYLPQKVAMISLSELQLNSTMGHTNSSSGGIGNITIVDLSPYSLPHKQILSVGGQRAQLDMEESKAFTFKYFVKTDQDSGNKNDFLDVEMASAYYTHNPHFINQVGMCVGDFKQYAYNLAKSLQNTASDLAKSMVSTKRQLCEHSFNQSLITDFVMDDVNTDDKTVKSKLLFSVIVETPVIYLPRDLSDLELIVCNLGKITANNSFYIENDISSESPQIDKLTVEIQKINLAVLKLSTANVQDIIYKNIPLHSCITNKDSNQIVILHNTDLFIQADKVSTINRSTNFLKSSFTLDGKVNTALKLFLSVPTYKQILSTIQFACDIKEDSWKPSVPTPNVMSPVVEIVEEVDDPDISFTFQMPSLQLELHGELQGQSHGFVNVECDMFHLKYTHVDQHLTLSLQDFFIEDLLCKSSDKFRYLIRSGEKKEISNYLYRTSSSCPEYSGTSNVTLLSKSLPDISAGFSPGSLPSDTFDSDMMRLNLSKDSNGPLFSLQVIFNKDSDQEEHADKRFEIDLNSIDLVINLQTWVILFDFFGIGVQNPPSTPVKVNESTVNSDIGPNNTIEKFEVVKYAMNIKTVMCYLNKEEYPLAKVVVDNLNFNATLSNDNQDISGNIGIIELHDLSPFNGVFMKRLITLGDSAIKFEFYRFGKPDPDLEREFDMKLCLSMSSVQYIHTQRFLIEVISFCQHFVFLQEVLGRMRAASAGDEVLEYINRCPRVILKINTDAPILILPRRSNSRDVLVANLGKLDIQNKFLYASDPKTEAFSFIASQSRSNVSPEMSPIHTKQDDRLLDCIQIRLSDMLVYMAAKVEDESYHYLDMFVKQGKEIMCEPCTLELNVERNLEWAFGRQVPDMSVSGRLSSIALFIDLAQYGQIMDMLADNLGEPLDTFIAPSTVLVDPLVLSLPVHQLWTTLRMKIHLSNVSIVASHEFSYGELKSVEESLGRLARFDLVESDLIFESFSDGSKSIDLKSSDVLIYDIRNDNMTKILLPSPKELQKKEYLQFEIHYLDTKEKAHLTFLCNQSRILLQFDFLLDTFRFILRAKENEYKNTQMSASSPQIQDNTSNLLTKSPIKTANGPPKMFELKVNVTESELVVVEDINSPDTRTVILQTTAVLAFRPDHSSEKPVTCSLQSLEIFSCHLNQPDDSALSIVDPVAFLVELTSGNQKSSGSRNVSEQKPVLEVQFQVPVYLRLSYHDVQMFLQIVNKAKEQLSKALDGIKEDNSMSALGSAENNTKLVRFQNDTENNSQENKGVSLKDAIILQTDSSSSLPLVSKNTSKILTKKSVLEENKPAPSAISGIEIKANFVSITLIDDCGNNEVPLIDLSLNDLRLNHYYDPKWKGLTDCRLDADYYNTRVSAWEPLIEGWQFNTHWFKTPVSGNKAEKTAVKIDAPERLDINLTNAFIDITNKTANLWRSRFYVDAASNEKKRAPFLPFLLRNKVGCNLSFSTLMKSPAKTVGKTRRKEIHQEFAVDSNAEVAFAFEGRTKQRHQGSHQLMVHQIVIQIPGKFDIQPITVDKVGRVFRIAYNSESNQVHQNEDSLNDVYLIIDISLEGARKVITVKTALSICNNLTTPVEIVGTKNDKHYQLASIDVNETYIVPITLLQCKLYCRPIKGSSTYQYSDELSWRDVRSRGEKGVLRCCPGEVDQNLVFRFCAIIRCLGFPKAHDWELEELYQPEHIITLTHHILIYNQLPFDLFYNVKGRAMKELIKPGGKAPLQFKDSGSTIEIGFSFEGFPHYDTVKIVYEDQKYMIPLRVYDIQNRLLILHAVVMCRSGSIQISVYAPYWLINKTGIPLVFRREEESVEIAGQFEEHEEARSLTPLPFSFLTTTDNYNCQIRIGKDYQHCKGKTPLWSKPFSLEKENDHRTLYVRERRDLPEKGYNVGIMMTWGKGVYSQTKIVSFVPRFQIYNQTSKNIFINQKCMINDKNVTLQKGTLCPRGAVTIFHWPSCNLDNLLCVRMEESALWSGCIKIDCETTFHINMKTNNKNSTYFRAHISFSAGTYRTTFNDANTFPPPFKIINLSEVALFYWQETKSNEPYGTFIKAKEAKDYALDEPLMSAKLTVSVYQESIHTYDLKHNGKHQAKLYYQNAIFIGLTHTFSATTCKCGHDGIKNSDEQYVLDVINDKNIYLNRKADHRRSQLWRMNANGNLVHFDSTTAKDKFSSNNILVLDVDDSKEGDFYPLVLNQLNSNRKKTQTWFFEKNMLRCCVAGYVVHPVSIHKDKFLVVLGLKCLITDDEHPLKSCITSYRLRPGSGVLSAYIFSRGPTQVLEITDSQQENSHDSWVMVEPSVSSHSSFTCTSLRESPSTELVVSLASGLGISVINLLPEEIIFVSLRQMNFNINFNEDQYSVDLEIGKIQIDNQLFGCQAPVAIYASPTKGSINKKAPDLRLEIKIEKDMEFDLLVFKKFGVDMCRMMVVLEDRLCLKLIQAVQNLVADSSNDATTDEATSIFDSHKIDHIENSDQKRLFFEDITINQGDLTISLIVTGKIDKDLVALKSALGIPLVSFESAVFGFERYSQNNMYDTGEHLLFHLIQFYKSTFISQAAVLLGSLDLLGNPMGLIQDFSSGIEGLLKKGNLGGLFVNVAHGFSDSAAKMTGVIADSLWSASMDNKFLESRDSLRVSRGSSSSTHFSAGLQGLGMGVIGGLTSMVTQPIEGAAKKGFSGFFAGLGKGLVGTVAKPVAGVLDLASGTAAAVRNTTETTTPVPLPVRSKRNCYGPGGVLGKYSKIASDGQDILLKFNDGITSEKYVGMESVRTSPDRLKALFTNKGVYFVKSGPPCPENIKLHVDYTRLLDSSYYFEERHHIIEIYFCRRQNIGVRKPSVDTRTTIRCDNERIAFKVCEKINYLKSLHLESLYMISDTQEYG